MKRVLENYSSLLLLFQEIEEESSDSETVAKVSGILAKMNQHKFYFGMY